MFEITLFLFGKPQWELEKITPRILQSKADEIHQRLLRAATLTEKLRRAGWHVFLDTYSLVLYHDTILSEQELRKQLHTLGITLKKTELSCWDETTTPHE